jgi:predicted component of type VI protein secretion system
MQVERLLASNLSCIFADEDFRRFEAAWRGAEVILRQGIGDAGQTRLFLVPVFPHGLPDALDALREPVSAILPNLIIIDMPFDQSPWSLDLLNRVAQFAENLLAPAAVWIAPAFLHLRNWDEMHRLPLLKNHLEGAFYAKWRKLMARPYGSWLAATCNRFLTRYPYGSGLLHSFAYLEEKEPLWISPVWALATLAAQSVNAFAWPSRFTDDGNIRLRDLAVRDSPHTEPAATETLIHGERIRQLIEIGIMPLAGAAGRDTACMPGETTIGGESLSFQLFFSLVIAFLIRRREAYDTSRDGRNPKDYLYQTLEDFFTTRGWDPPRDLSVEAGIETSETIQLEIAFTLPISIQPGARRIAFTFSW